MALVVVLKHKFSQKFYFRLQFISEKIFPTFPSHQFALSKLHLWQEKGKNRNERRSDGSAEGKEDFAQHFRRPGPKLFNCETTLQK